MSDWSDIRVSFPKGEGLHPDNSYFIKSRDAEGRYLLVADLSEEITLDKIPKLQGIIPNIVPSEKGSSYLTLALEDSSNLDKFQAVCMNIAERTIGLSGEIFVERTLELLYSWAKFIRPSRSGLSDFEHVGLLAELYVLKNYMLPALGPELAVKSWIGPEGAKQDFVVENFALEIKAHRSGYSDKITISSVEQLYAQTEKLFLIKLGVSPSESSEGFSLESLERGLMKELNTDPVTENLFQFYFFEKTEKASEEQLRQLFQDNELTVYEVNDDFPKLTPEDLNEGIDLDSVSYKIETNAITSFIVDKSLEELIDKLL